jgi:hypothetical protein
MSPDGPAGSDEEGQASPSRRPVPLGRRGPGSNPKAASRDDGKEVAGSGYSTKSAAVRAWSENTVMIESSTRLPVVSR